MDVNINKIEELISKSERIEEMVKITRPKVRSGNAKSATKSSTIITNLVLAAVWLINMKGEIIDPETADNLVLIASLVANTLLRFKTRKAIESIF